MAKKQKKAHMHTIPHAHDILLPSISPGYFQHVGKAANSNIETRIRENKLKKHNLHMAQMNEEKLRLAQEKIVCENDRKAEKMLLRKKIQDRVREKIKAYKAKVDDRRARLSEFLFMEERHAYYATIDLAQKSANTKLEEMRMRAEEIKSKRECEQQKLLEMKRLQQYSQRCHDLKHAISKKILVDSKEAQLMQIKENEMKREIEKEVEDMWTDLVMKEVKKKEDREEQELIKAQEITQDLIETWNKQIQGKQLVKAELRRLDKENFDEIERFMAEVDENADNAADLAKQKQELYREELKRQMEINKLITDQRKSEEDQFNKKMHELALAELAREESRITDTRKRTKEESKLYRRYLQQLQAEKQEEEKMFEEMLKNHQEKVQEQNNDAYCKTWNKKEKLRREVVGFRDQQIKAKQELEKKEKEERILEDKVAKQIYDTNKCLQNEFLIRSYDKKKQYKDDLLQQIEYNKILKQREKEETERMYQKSLEEDEMYMKKVEELLTDANSGRKHKFRAILENPCCPCPDKM